ncbi:MAG TPA: glutamate-5-semialdehyde dehydrogenase [Candidatus Caccousia avistercoris]|nr:glutamate-5-semialdehyde dehydrogenase [Candidatus Caccousia avistercoris]
MTELQKMGERAKAAARSLACAGPRKDKALLAMAQALEDGMEGILEANRQDVEAARAGGMSASLLDRLSLSQARVQAMAEGVRQVAAQADPIGSVVKGGQRPNGMSIRQIRVPLGVVGIIYEARPNVTADAAALCLKAGNAVILRGGKEAIRSNSAILDCMAAAAQAAGLPEGSLQLVRDTTRASSLEMMGLTGYLDVLIPRGGAGLIRTVVENSRVPVIETGVGNCHLFLDETAEPDMAVRIAVNGKTSRPSVCNALEKLLVHQKAAAGLLPLVGRALAEKGVQLRACPRALAILTGAGVPAVPAAEEDWDREYLDLVMAVRVVEDLDQALAHIAAYSSGHSECIVTENYANARRFTQEVDAAAVYVNCSTRFTDGGEFGLGAEIGISTQKLHARGPMGVNELTSTKFVIEGDGQIR